jgi:hypothetical protein
MGTAYKIDKKNSILNLRIAIASIGQTMGLEDVINERNYTTSVTCKSN